MDGAGHAAGQDQHIVFIKIQQADSRIGQESDLVGRSNRQAVGNGDLGQGNTGPVKDIHNCQGFDLFTAVRHKDRRFFIGFVIHGFTSSLRGHDPRAVFLSFLL